MSGFNNPPTETDPLYDSEKTDIRRFMWYPAKGMLSSFNEWFYNQQEYTLEWRMDNLGDSDIDVVRNMLSVLNSLETALTNIGFGKTDNLSTDHAGVWYHNKKEIDDRNNLFTMRRLELCKFFALQPGQGYSGGNSMRLYN